MVFFTTPELLEIGGMPLTTPYDKPTRAEALQYYRKVVDTFQLQVSLFEKVTAVEPQLAEAASGREPAFVVESRTARGVTRVREARNVVLAMGYYDAAEHAQHPRRGSAARHALLQGSAPVLSPARRDRRRQELGGRGGARDSSRRRPRHDGASRAGVRRLGEVLGEARHREPREGRLDRRALQRERGRDSPERGRPRFGHDACRPKRCCC